MASRRQNGEGTIYQRKNGLWVCELTIGYDMDGKRIRKTLSSMDLEKLKAKVNETKYKADIGIIIQSNHYTLNDWIQIWLDTYVHGNVKTKTYDNYVYAFEKHIKPSIGGFQISRVTNVIIQSFINCIANQGYSLSTIKKPYIVLNQALKKAVSNQLIAKNPCEGIVLPKKKPRKVVSMTVEEQEKFESACPDTTYGRMFLFALNTGMRVGEILALTWNDISFQKKYISVEKTVVEVVNRNGSGKKTVLEMNETKTTSGIRKIPMSDKAYEILKAQRSLSNLFVFESKNGKILNYRNVRRALKKVLDITDIETHITMHALRHTFATRLIERGGNIKAISELLGHKNISITLDTYAHVLNQFKENTIALLNT